MKINKWKMCITTDCEKHILISKNYDKCYECS